MLRMFKCRLIRCSLSTIYLTMLHMRKPTGLFETLFAAFIGISVDFSLYIHDIVFISPFLVLADLWEC